MNRSLSLSPFITFLVQVEKFTIIYRSVHLFWHKHANPRSDLQYCLGARLPSNSTDFLHRSHQMVLLRLASVSHRYHLENHFTVTHIVTYPPSSCIISIVFALLSLSPCSQTTSHPSSYVHADCSCALLSLISCLSTVRSHPHIT